MLIKRRKPWDLPDSAVTDERVFRERRRLMQAVGAGTMLAAGGVPLAALAAKGETDPTAGLYPVKRNPEYKVERPLTPEELVTTYNNFYEFGSHKKISRAAQKMDLRPWQVKIDGMVEKAMTVGFDDLIRRMPLEERVYRLRCVEAWSIAVPWSGFPLRALVDFAKPTSGAKYLEMQTLADKDTMPGLRQPWYPWPYVEGLTIEEARNELAFIATGLYGKPIPKQNGAPLRLAVPWKYGFKSVKSIIRFSFTDKRPKTFWEVIQPQEYGFWANVNPEVDHPRWSQATERVLGTDERVPTQLFNGYAEQVAYLYEGKTAPIYFR